MYTSYMSPNASTTASEVTSFDPLVDADFFMRNKDYLLGNFSGHFVAIRNEKVVADAEDYFSLYWRLCEMYGGPVSAYIRQVYPEAFLQVGTEPAHLILRVGEMEAR